MSPPQRQKDKMTIRKNDEIMGIKGLGANRIKRENAGFLYAKLRPF
jgi:hypothetical protein